MITEAMAGQSEKGHGETRHRETGVAPDPESGPGTGPVPPAPWSVKGIAPQTREAVKEAARRSGMTIGEWLSAAITRQAEAEPTHTRPARPTSTDERWAEVAADLARLLRRESTIPAPPQPRYSGSVRAIEQLLRETEARAIRREQVRAARLAEALTQLARYIDNAERRQSDEVQRASLEHAQSIHAMSQALTRINRHVKGVARHIALVPEQAAATAREAAERTAAAHADALVSRLLPAVDERLAAGLRQILDTLDARASGDDGQSGTAIPDAEQIAVEDRLARAILDIRSRQVALARLEAEDDTESQQAIIERLEELSRKLDSALRPADGDAPAAVGAMLEQLSHIRSRLDEDRPLPALARVEDMVRHLSENVEALHLSSAPTEPQAGDVALDTLATQISQVARRLEELTHQQAAAQGAEPNPAAAVDAESRVRLQGLETAIGTLSLQLRELPRADEATLERMARTVAREALIALAPDDVVPAARSEDTLEAVHNTLERIVDRLALLEEDIRAGNIGPMPAGDGLPAEATAAGRDPLSEPERRAAQALSRAFAAADAQPGQAIDEPENLLRRDSSGLTENLGFTAGFIAAARRAAMAAADETRQRPGAAPAAAQSTSETGGRRRSLLIGLGALIAATGAAQVAATLSHGAIRLS